MAQAQGQDPNQIGSTPGALMGAPSVARYPLGLTVKVGS
jgi:hypothetical protein